MNIDAHLIEHLADRAMFQAPTIPRSREQFLDRGKQAVNFLSVAVQDAASLLPDLFADFQTTRSQATVSFPPAWRGSYADVQRQLEALVCPNFLVETPWQWLVQFPRYLKAVRFRLERLPQGTLNSDMRGTKEIKTFENRYRERLASHQARGVIDPEIVTYRWMLEEYRVSLFAQKLGTAVPVSAKRLDRQWKKVRD